MEVAEVGKGEKSSKIQIPDSNEISSSTIHTRQGQNLGFEIWNLELLWNLDFGFWNFSMGKQTGSKNRFFEPDENSQANAA
jgi:hypothetical protein